MVLSVPLMTRHDLWVTAKQPLLRRAETFTDKREEVLGPLGPQALQPGILALGVFKDKADARI